ncbi:MAG: HAMP domain-containing protein [Candidatus Lokiarchaeota archaeon]|nr:HAMP domain-containing protein [Candidatus Lokiarchaeota archaeon]
MARNEKSGRSFKRTMLVTFLVITTASIALTTGFSMGFGYLIGDTTTSQSVDALKNQARDDMLSTGITTSNVINQKLTTAEGMVASMAEEIEHIFSSDNTYESRETYYDYFFEYSSDGPHPDDIAYDPDYGINVSWSYSSWYIPGSNSSNYESYESSYADRLGRVSNMDFLFKSIHERIPEFRWLYFTFADNDMFINYPGSILGGSDTDRNTDPWYPTQDYWYTEIAGGYGDMVFVEPYYDPIDQVLLISIGKAVYRESGSLLGVIAGDITIGDIRDQVLNIDVYETGYAALIQEDGLVVAHEEVPDSAYEQGLPDFAEVEGNTLTTPQIGEITSGQDGYLEYTRSGEDRLLVYTPVGKGGYICVLVVPVNEVLEAIPALENRISTTLRTTIQRIMYMALAGIVISGVVGYWVAGTVTGPLNQIMDRIRKAAVAKFTKSKIEPLELKLDSRQTSRKDEIGDLSRAFDGLMGALIEEEEEDQ